MGVKAGYIIPKFCGDNYSLGKSAQTVAGKIAGEIFAETAPGGFITGQFSYLPPCFKSTQYFIMNILW
jgi:hypothetical protein